MTLSFAENVQFVWSRIAVKSIQCTESVIHASISRRNATYMPIVPFKVNNSDETVFAFLDTASSNTFCSRRLANKLGIAGKTETLNISIIADTISTESKLVQLDVSSLDGTCINMLGNFVIDKIPVKSSAVDVSMYDHLNDIKFSSLNGAEMVDLLIGQDHSKVLMPLEIRKGNMDEPFAIRSVLGGAWMTRRTHHVWGRKWCLISYQPSLRMLPLRFKQTLINYGGLKMRVWIIWLYHERNDLFRSFGMRKLDRLMDILNSWSHGRILVSFVPIM